MRTAWRRTDPLGGLRAVLARCRRSPRPITTPLNRCGSAASEFGADITKGEAFSGQDHGATHRTHAAMGTKPSVSAVGGVGVIATGSTLANRLPVNPRTTFTVADRGGSRLESTGSVGSIALAINNVGISS